MTSEEYYKPADEKIAQLKKKGIDPYQRAKSFFQEADKGGKVKIELKALDGSKDTMNFYLQRESFGKRLKQYTLYYENGVKCHALPADSFPYTPWAVLTKELLAMSYCMDLTWKQYFIDCARANGDDV